MILIALGKFEVSNFTEKSLDHYRELKLIGIDFGAFCGGFCGDEKILEFNIILADFLIQTVL